MKNTFESLMAKTKKLSYKELEKEGNTLYYQKVAREEDLLTAFKEKKLKSKTLIKEAKKINSRRKKQKDENNGDNK